jgi:integrase
MGILRTARWEGPADPHRTRAIQALPLSFASSYSKPSETAPTKTRAISFGERQVREITTRDIDVFPSKLTVSRKTKKNIFSTLKLILKQGWAWGNVREKVWESAKKIGKSETEIRAYTDAEVESILGKSTGAKRLFYWLAVETGMRAGELCGLRVYDVDSFRKLVRVRQAIWHGKVQTPKTKNAIRDIPIPVEIVNALSTHIGGRKEGFVFTTKNGTPWNADLLLRRHLRKELKVVNGNLHMFRHTFATRQLNARVPVSVVSKLLGNGSISTTLNIYTHVLAEHLEQFEVSVPKFSEFRPLIGHLTDLTAVELHKSGKSRNINDAGWSSLVARRAHNPKVVSSNLTPATNFRCSRPEPRTPAFSFVQVMTTGLSSFLASPAKSEDSEPDSHRPVLVCNF